MRHPTLGALGAFLFVCAALPSACGGGDSNTPTPKKPSSGGSAGAGASGGSGARSGGGGSGGSGGRKPSSGGSNALAGAGDEENGGAGGAYDPTPHQQPSDCTDNQIYNGTYCATCPPCDGKGEAGPYPDATAIGSCICKTRTGYFYSTAAEVGTFPCDADGDGWVRASARSSLEANDPVLKANARCDLRVIDHIVFSNEAGDQKSEDIKPTELYETDRNDADELLDLRLEVLGIPAYGRDGSQIPAAQINPLTKFCHTPFADYNDNGLADVSEWEGSTKPPTVRADQAVFIQFSYFAELFNGHYEGPQSKEKYGHYVIEERSRLPTAKPDERVPVGYGPTEGTYWQRCDLLPDSAADSAMPPVGMDFASEGIMNFHSQFKCLTIASTHDANNPNAVLPSELGDTYRLNRCGGQGAPTPADGNPDLGTFKCDIVASTDAVAGDVLWGAVRYDDYPTPDKYVRGCINECADPDNGCPDVAPGISGCIRDVDDFGHKLGCAEQCDGLDNDGDGVIDNGTNGLDCQTNYPGVCATGKTKCQNGKLSCEGTKPGELPERCDSIDQDCDGDPVTGTLNPIPEVGQLCTTAESFTDGVYKTLVGQCRFGTTQCIEDQVTHELRLSCVSDMEGSIPPEDPCNNADDDCDGDIDETRTKYEGDNPAENRSQCHDGIDNNCDGVIDPHPAANMPWASQLTAHVAEICDNDVDDDCDGIVDERYQTSASNGTTGVDGPACAFACDAVDQGKLACSILGDRQPLERFQPAGPDNTPQTWFFDPPWFDKYWKVIKCQDGYWQINEVCGLDQTQLPRVAGNWGGNFGAQGCKSSSPGVAACTSDTTGLTFAGCADTAPPGGRDTPTPASCLDCWDPTAGTVGLVSDVCASRTQ